MMLHLKQEIFYVDNKFYKLGKENILINEKYIFDTVWEMIFYNK